MTDKIATAVVFFSVMLSLSAAATERPAGIRGVNERTREEKVKIFTDREFGRRVVERPDYLVFAPETPDRVMMDGAAVRRQVRITYGGPYGTNSFVVTAFLPKARRPAPAFLLVNNRHPDLKMADSERAVKTAFWPAEEIVSRGYAALVFQVWDVAPDWNTGCTEGVFACFEKKVPYRPTNSWGTLSAWAWGASRVMDWIETEPAIDGSRVAVVGHSRGGKTALWTAVTDTRFAYACVNGSGCAGAKLNHLELPKSEHIAYIFKVFPYWFCADYCDYANREMEMDFDQHELLSCVAPRLLAVGSGADDAWAGPEGERLATELAAEAWKDATRVHYHVRPGGHDLNLEDWRAYMDHAANHGW